MICRKGVMKDGVFYEEGTNFHFRPLVPKYLVIPEDVSIFLEIDQQVIANDFVLAQLHWFAAMLLLLVAK